MGTVIIGASKSVNRRHGAAAAAGGGAMMREGVGPMTVMYRTIRRVKQNDRVYVDDDQFHALHLHHNARALADRISRWKERTAG